MLVRLLMFVTCFVCSSYAEDETAWSPRILRSTSQCPACPKCPKCSSCDASPASEVSTLPSSHLVVGGSYRYVRMSAGHEGLLTGSLGGAQISYEYQTANRIYGGLLFAARDGSVYGGGVHRSLLDIDIQERIGYTFGSETESWLISLFSGLGYRRLGEKVSSSGSSVTFNYNDLYCPVGALIQGSVNRYISLGVNGQWRPQVYPTVTILPLHGARWNTTYKLANFLMEVPAILTLYSTFTIALKPYIEYWQDGHTTAKTEAGLVLGVPENHYWFLGCDVNFGWAF